ncbi:MAG: hypothetical protein ACOCP8_04845 [archaeon]
MVKIYKIFSLTDEDYDEWYGNEEDIEEYIQDISKINNNNDSFDFPEVDSWKNGLELLGLKSKKVADIPDGKKLYKIFDPKNESYPDWYGTFEKMIKHIKKMVGDSDLKLEDKNWEEKLENLGLTFKEVYHPS